MGAHIIHSHKYGDFTVLVDDEDDHIMREYSFCINYSKKNKRLKSVQHTIYNKETRKETIRSLNCVIMNPPKGMVVDCINGDILDSRRSNLRVCTQHQDLMNKGRHTGRTTARGVYLHRGKIKSQISYNGKVIYLGTFKTLEEAVAARKKAELEYFGEFAPSVCRPQP